MKKKIIFGILAGLIIAAVFMLIIFRRPDKESKKEEETMAEDYFKTLTLADSYKKEKANNAIYTQRFGADPGVMEYDGRIYI